MNNRPMITAALTLQLWLFCQNPVFAADPITARDSVQVQIQQEVYGSQLMTEQERKEIRSKIRAATTREEREKIRAENHERMEQRAKEQGVTLANKKPKKQAGRRLSNATDRIDPRQRLALSQAQQAFVLTEMRSLLAGTQAIVSALATDDMETVTEQARLLGMGMKKPENKLQDVLPKPFMMQGKAVHLAFDRIADDAASIKDPKHTLKQLGEALRLCTGCHEMYQIEANSTNATVGRQIMKPLRGSGFGEMNRKRNQ